MVRTYSIREQKPFLLVRSEVFGPYIPTEAERKSYDAGSSEFPKYSINPDFVFDARISGNVVYELHVGCSGNFSAVTLENEVSRFLTFIEAPGLRDKCDSIVEHYGLLFKSEDD